MKFSALRAVLGLSVGVLGLAVAASATPVSCVSLEGDNVTTISSCQLGSLTFSDFGVNSSPSGVTIALSSVGTGVSGDEVDLGFQMTEPIGVRPIDTILSYAVTGTLIGVDVSQNGVDTSIQETVCSAPFSGGICPSGDVLANYSNPPTPNGTEVFLTSPVTTAYILKDIQEPSQDSTISSFVNSQVVPEPMTFSLIGMGLLGIGVMGRRRSRKG